MKMSPGGSIRCPRRVSIHNTFVEVSRFRGLGNIARDNGGERFKVRVCLTKVSDFLLYAVK